MIQVDGDNQRFGQGMAVRLAREDHPLRRKDDTRELLEVGDAVCGACTAADLHVVVVPLQQALPIEGQCLLFTVGRDIRGEADLETTPRLACFLPRLEFFGFTTRSNKAVAQGFDCGQLFMPGICVLSSAFHLGGTTDVSLPRRCHSQSFFVPSISASQSERKHSAIAGVSIRPLRMNAVNLLVPQSQS